MAINYTAGEYVVPNETYYQSLIQAASTPNDYSRIQALGYLRNKPAEVSSSGNLSDGTAYIKVVPVDTKSAAYNNGNGLTVYFGSDAALNSSFEISTAFTKDEVIRCYNNSGSTIASGKLVYQSGFNATEQEPEISLADASANSTSIVLGITQESIANGASGSVLIVGAFETDTSSYTRNQRLYLSNTAGDLSTSPGDVAVVVGVVTSAATEGAIRIGGLPSAVGLPQIKVAETTLSDVSSSATATSLIPAGAVLLGVTARVTTAVTTSGSTNTFSIGTAGDADAFGANIAGTSGTTTSFSDATVNPTTLWSASATNVVLDAAGAETFTAGAVKLKAFYFTSVAPDA